MDNEKIVDEDGMKNKTEQLKSQNSVLQEEINNLNFQLSTLIIQNTKAENVRKEVSIHKKRVSIFIF
jgi:hypothetical protein